VLTFALARLSCLYDSARKVNASQAGLQLHSWHVVDTAAGIVRKLCKETNSVVISVE